MKLKKTQGPNEITRYNLYNSAAIRGAPARGYTSAEAMEALQGDHTSVLGLQFAPRLLEVIDRAQELAAGFK